MSVGLTKRVLVLGDNDLACLAVVRSLGRAGLDVDLVAWYDTGITRSSRYVRRVLDCGDPSRETSRFVEGVSAAAAKGGYDLIIPVLEVAIRPLLPVAETLRAHARLALPEAEAFEATRNKAETIQLAQACGADVPATRVVSSLAEIGTLCPPSGFPLVLKPAFGGTVRRVWAPEQLQDWLSSLVPQSPVLVQELCPGQGIGLEVLARRGEVLAAFQHERVHEPPEGGASSYRRSVPLSQPLLDLARRMCARLNWTGPAMIEFKRDSATGRAALMEINGRFWGSLALSIFAGVDFPKLLYDALVREAQISVFAYRVHRYARNTARDVFWYMANWRAPANRPDLLKVRGPQLLRECGNLLRGRECFDVETLRDPIPGLLNWQGILGEVHARMAGKISAWHWRHRARRLGREVRRRSPRLLRRLRGVRSVLFVCAGNINRSVFAELLTRRRLAPGAVLAVASAGLMAREGRACCPTAVECARSFGVDLYPHRSRSVSQAMLAGADLVFIMEAAQLGEIHSLDRTCLARTALLGSWDPGVRVDDIPDPHGAERAVYQKVYARISRCVDEWLAAQGLRLPREGGSASPGPAPGVGRSEAHRPA